MEDETWTDEEVKPYKEFIDGLLGWPSSSVQARWVEEWGDGKAKSYCLKPEFDALMASLSPEQRKTIAELLRHERHSGIHETLTYLDDGPYEIYAEGKPLPEQPYYNFMHEDWSSRSLGYPWPDEEEDEFPKKPA